MNWTGSFNSLLRDQVNIVDNLELVNELLSILSCEISDHFTGLRTAVGLSFNSLLRDQRASMARV